MQAFRLHRVAVARAATTNVPVRRASRSRTVAARAGPQSTQQQKTTPQQQQRLRDGETPEQAAERRARESARVEERVLDIDNPDAWRSALESAGDRLVVLEVGAEGICQTGLEEEADLNWELDKKLALKPCLQVKSTLQRTARECPDVVFLTLSADTEGGSELVDELGIEVLPTLQFWRRGRMLWEHRGVLSLEQDLGEGVLFFSGTTGEGGGGDDAEATRATRAGPLDTGGLVTELKSRAELDAFVAGPPPPPESSSSAQQQQQQQQQQQVLSVVDVSTAGASPCIHIFPAVVALARSFRGYARFARLLADDVVATATAGGGQGETAATAGQQQQQQLLRELGVVEVPTFIFYRGGVEVGRHVGSSRGDLMGRIMEVQAEAGVRPPPPPSSGTAAGGGAAPRKYERKVMKRRV